MPHGPLAMYWATIRWDEACAIGLETKRAASVQPDRWRNHTLRVVEKGKERTQSFFATALKAIILKPQIKRLIVRVIGFMGWGGVGVG